MLQVSGKTRNWLNLEFHADIAFANFGRDLRNLCRHSAKLRPWKTIESHSCQLSRLDSPKRCIGGELRRPKEPPRRNDGSPPFSPLNNRACPQDRSLSHTPFHGGAGFPSLDLGVPAIPSC